VGVRITEQVNADVGVTLLIRFGEQVAGGLLSFAGVPERPLPDACKLVLARIGPPKTGLLSGEGDEMALGRLAEDVLEKSRRPLCSLVRSNRTFLALGSSLITGAGDLSLVLTLLIVPHGFRQINRSG
jgi:hypothetical protein